MPFKKKFGKISAPLMSRWGEDEIAVVEREGPGAAPGNIRPTLVLALSRASARSDRQAVECAVDQMAPQPPK